MSSSTADLPSDEVYLSFDPSGITDKPFRDSLSAIVEDPRSRAGRRLLWTASDEHRSVQLLHSSNGKSFQQIASIDLARCFGLKGEKEIDLEGLAFDEHQRLWMVGSHALVRKDRKKNTGPEELLERLREVEPASNRNSGETNRLLLGYLNVEISGDSHTEINVVKHASLPITGIDNVLTKELRDDPLLANFLTIPSKDNGFDIEGIAVYGDRVFLGLRGPVLRGWAFIVEIEVKEDDDALALKRIGRNGERYWLHPLYLNGLGTRDLCAQGNDMLVLAGPTMSLDGPAAIYRWRNPRDARISPNESNLFPQFVGGVSCGKDCDRPEGMTLLDWGTAGERPSVMVVYDKPDESKRCKSDQAVVADVFTLGDLPK